jgi:hypothetical protein
LEVTAGCIVYQQGGKRVRANSMHVDQSLDEDDGAEVAILHGDVAAAAMIAISVMPECSKWKSLSLQHSLSESVYLRVADWYCNGEKPGVGRPSIHDQSALLIQSHKNLMARNWNARATGR